MPSDTMGIKLVTDDQKLRFSHLHKRTHLVTKFADTGILKQLCLINGIRTMLRSGGLENFLTKAAQTYPRLTIEFLCTLEDNETEVPYISFRLFNRPYTLTYAEIADAFGWEIPAEECNVPDDGTLVRFWSESTNRPYN